MANVEDPRGKGTSAPQIRFCHLGDQQGGAGEDVEDLDRSIAVSQRSVGTDEVVLNGRNSELSTRKFGERRRRIHSRGRAAERNEDWKGRRRREGEEGESRVWARVRQTLRVVGVVVDISGPQSKEGKSACSRVLGLGRGECEWKSERKKVKGF